MFACSSGTDTRDSTGAEDNLDIQDGADVVDGADAGDSADSGDNADTQNSSDTETQLITDFGVVIALDEIEPDFDAAESSIVATFGRYVTPVTLSDAIETFRRPIDTCVISEENAGNNRVDNFLAAPAFTAISAGSALSYNAANGLFFQASSFDGGQPEIFYPVFPSPDFPLPAGITVSIPGADFPATEAALPDVAPLTGFLPVSNRGNTVITADTQFTWQAGSDSNARILIRSDISGFGSRLPPAGFDCDFIDDDGICQLSPLDFFCDVQDDGFFEFAEEFKAALGPAYVNEGEFMAVRRSVNTVVQDSTLLQLVRDREAD